MEAVADWLDGPYVCDVRLGVERNVSTIEYFFKGVCGWLLG